MAYKVSITAKGEAFSTDYENIDDLYQTVNSLAGHYGDYNLVAASDTPFVAVKFKDIEKVEVSGISRTELRTYALEKAKKDYAEKVAAQAQYASLPHVGAQMACESTSGNGRLI